MNYEILERPKEAVKANQDSQENKVNLKIFYEQKVLNSIFKQDFQGRQILLRKLRAGSLFLDVAKVNVGQSIK